MTRMPYRPAQCVTTASCVPSDDHAGCVSPTFSSTPHWPEPSGFIEPMPVTSEKAMRPFAASGEDGEPLADVVTATAAASTAAAETTFRLLMADLLRSTRRR